VGQGLLYLGIVLLEIPSQMVIQRVGPQKWLTFQVLCFGLVSTLELFMHDYGSFLGTRILLGVVECGYIPGALYVLSTFYKRSELGSRTSFFFLGNVLVAGMGGLLAAGIFKIKGPLHPWQYLFLVEGSLALFCALLFLVLLPDSPARPVPLLFPRLTLLTAREMEIVRLRVVLDDAAKAAATRRLTGAEILDTVGNWRNYPHILHAIACVSATSAMSQYQPLLIKGFGFSTIRANLYSSVGGWIALVVMVTSGLLSDRLRNKGWLVMLLTACSLVMWIAFQATSTSADKYAKYVTLFMTTGFSLTWHPINATWLSLNQKTPQQRAVAMAMFVMAANLGALVGSQLLRARDAPTYPVGFRVCVALFALATATAVFQHMQYRLSNRRNEARLAAGKPLREDRVVSYIL
jgi:predicted MFS family arabinose efflux permease